MYTILFFVGKHLALKEDRYKVIDLIVQHIKKRINATTETHTEKLKPEKLKIVFIDKKNDPSITSYVNHLIKTLQDVSYFSDPVAGTSDIHLAKAYLSTHLDSNENLLLISEGFIFTSDYPKTLTADQLWIYLSINEETKGIFYDLDETGKVKQTFEELPAQWNDAYRSVGSFMLSKTTLLALPEELTELDDNFIQWFMKRDRCFGQPLGGFFVNLLSHLPGRIDRLASWLSRGFHPCLFLDRDGVMIEDTSYPHKAEHAKILKGVIPLIKYALDQYWYVVVVSNQAGIAKGHFTFEDYTAFTSYLRQLFLSEGLDIKRWQGCPYEPSGKVPAFAKVSLLRKPEAGMFLRSMEQQPIDRAKSVMIGDKPSDVIHHLQLKTFLLKGAYDIPEKYKEITYHDFESLVAAVKKM